MSNYSDHENSVRVDFFKPSGKWYATEAVLFHGYKESSIHTAFRDSLKQHLEGRMKGMTAVCLHPYHQHEHPLMLRIPEQGL